MSITRDLMGGRWEQAARHIRVDSEGWIRGHYIPTAIHSLHQYAVGADSDETPSSLFMLKAALDRLLAEIDRYEHRLNVFRQAVEELALDVVEARRDATAREEEDERLEELGLASDKLLERMAKLYGLGDHKDRT